MNTRTKIHQCSARAIFTAVPHGQQQAASTSLSKTTKGCGDKISPRHNNKGKENNRAKIPGNIKPAIPAAFRMHAWLGESRALGAEEKTCTRETLKASRRADSVVVLDCWIP